MLGCRSPLASRALKPKTIALLMNLRHDRSIHILRCFRGNLTAQKKCTSDVDRFSVFHKSIRFSHGFVGCLRDSVLSKDVLNTRILQRCLSQKSGRNARPERSKHTIVLYILAGGIFMFGVAYAGVPLYKMFCQAMGVGVQLSKAGHDADKVEKMKKIEDRQITVNFTAEIGASMQWKFRPQQDHIKVAPGETALIFYTARNPTDKPIIGISTYTVNPPVAANYFNKIQCFCFEEQILNPHEQVDMPVFFYIDPDYDDDPALEFIDQITLSYTFFEAKDGGMQLPYPGFPIKQPQ